MYIFKIFCSLKVAACHKYIYCKGFEFGVNGPLESIGYETNATACPSNNINNY